MDDARVEEAAARLAREEGFTDWPNGCPQDKRETFREKARGDINAKLDVMQPGRLSDEELVSSQPDDEPSDGRPSPR